MQPFDHYAPDSLPEALELLDSLTGAKAMAGGTDLLLQMKKGESQPGSVISLRKVDELYGITQVKDGFRLGACTTMRVMNRTPELKQVYPGLDHAVSVVASEQIRSLATVGGNICNASPGADLVPPLLALDAVACLVNLHGRRDVPLAEFFKGPGKTVLNKGELLHSVFLPRSKGKMVYTKHAPRQYMDLAVVGVAVRLHKHNGTVNQARIALGAVSPTPLRAEKTEALLTGKTLTHKIMQEAGETTAEECSPIDDIRGSAWYRTRMVKVLVRRNLEALL
ncbi:MAG: xanthine dehydrogenase family protein subunit M [Nitrospinaceae bacterium]|jgi:carbon-monoxide dehydrogenase medium subunit|nr:xanthine dehydrogenase family protein subunit M [Nitrospinaceae bacterium]MDP6734875.1 xanthine dehydrogenase family protein subunit M [Nitrospinaceae bacterium]|tara:strand:+ start:4406 stop:5245 length:840 start_codon:yes stop_codon:yes gene_type:complete